MAQFLLLAGLVGTSCAAGLASVGDLQLMQVWRTTPAMSRDEEGRSFFKHANVPVYPRAAQGNHTDRAWIFRMKSGTTDQDLQGMSQDPDFLGTGTHTYPDLGELPFVFGNLTADRLGAVMDKFSEIVMFVEEDVYEKHIFESIPGVDTISPDPITPGGVGISDVSDYCSGTSSRTSHIKYVNACERGKGLNVIAYILDTGVNCNHDEFEDRCLNYWDVSQDPKLCDGTEQTCAGDQQGHGTHVAGTVAGITIGVASGTTIRAVKVLNDAGGGNWGAIVEGISHVTGVASNGVSPSVICMSIQGAGTVQSVTDAINGAVASGVTVVVAAGNWEVDACTVTPGTVASAITVAAIQHSTTPSLASFSNYGTCVDILAPGVAIWSADEDDNSGFVSLSGTSMAAPIVVGIVAWHLEGQTITSITPAMIDASLKADALNATVTGEGNRMDSTTNLVAQAPPPTPVPTPAPTPQFVAGVGDPHLVNMFGERFDLYRTGVNVLLQIPRWVGPEQTLLHLEADAARIGGACSDVYFQVVRISGHWANESGSLEFFASANREPDSLGSKPNHMQWTRFGKVDLRVVNGTTRQGVKYLNVFAKKLGNAGYTVGGILGMDSNAEAKDRNQACARTMSLSTARAYG